MRKVHITIADDDLDDHHLVKEAIAELGLPCEINSVYNGLQLLDFLKNEQAYTKAEKPDVILLDLNMPLLNGFEALQQIKGNDKLRHLPVYVLSTSTSGYDMEKALDYGAAGYHSKSILFDDLKKLLKKICQEVA